MEINKYLNLLQEDDDIVIVGDEDEDQDNDMDNDEDNDEIDDYGEPSDEYEIEPGDILRCTICNRIVTVNEEGSGPLLCCNKPMIKIGEEEEGEEEIEEAGFSKMPKGWTKKSVKKFANSLVKHEAVRNAAAKKGFFNKCVKRMAAHMSNPQGFCASVKDQSVGSTYWRGKGKSPQKAAKQIKAHKNVK